MDRCTNIIAMITSMRGISSTRWARNFLSIKKPVWWQLRSFSNKRLTLFGTYDGLRSTRNPLCCLMPDSAEMKKGIFAVWASRSRIHGQGKFCQITRFPNRCSIRRRSRCCRPFRILTEMIRIGICEQTCRLLATTTPSPPSMDYKFAEDSQILPLPA